MNIQIDWILVPNLISTILIVKHYWRPEIAYTFFQKTIWIIKHAIYSLSKTAESQVAHLKATFDTRGMITGADIDEENGLVALVGYLFDADGVGFADFVWLFWDYEDNNFFSGKNKRVNLPLFAQTEGICYWKEGQFLISSEQSKNMRGKILKLDVSRWIAEKIRNELIIKQLS